jgi:hypothetical protein
MKTFEGCFPQNPTALLFKTTVTHYITAAAAAFFVANYPR